MSGSTGAVSAGRDQSLYFNDTADVVTAGAGTYAAPVWVLIDRIGDLDIDNTKSSTEVNMRAYSSTIKVFGNKGRELSFTYYKRAGNADTVFNVLEDSYENNTCLDLSIAEADIATSGTRSQRGPFVVESMARAEPVDGVVSYSITAAISDETTDGTTPFDFEPNNITP